MRKKLDHTAPISNPSVFPSNLPDEALPLEHRQAACLDNDGEDSATDPYPPECSHETTTLAVPVGIALAEMERLLITATLEKTGGNRSRAATILGIDRTTLYNKMKRHGIQ